ncbi:MAG TPA: hypothetical protein VN698_00935, partial [Bacteroidia bacterium]|nr:hypothetical protein [Bacteroidia bacterium]
SKAESDNETELNQAIKEADDIIDVPYAPPKSDVKLTYDEFKQREIERLGHRHPANINENNVKSRYQKYLKSYDTNVNEQPKEQKVGEQSQNKNNENAIQEQSTGGILQHPQEGVGEKGSERGGVESSKQGDEIANEGGQPPNNEEENQTTGEEKDVTSIKNEFTKEKRKELGLADEIPTAKKEFGTTWEEAKNKIENGYDVQDLVDELKKKPRPLTDLENALLLHHQNTKEIQLMNTTKFINDAAEKGDEGLVMEGKVRKARLLDELQTIYDVDKAVGTENARGLGTRRMMVDRKYSLVNMLAEKRATINDGKPLSESQTAEVEKLHAKIHETQEAFDKYVKEAEAEIKELQEKILSKKVVDKKSAAAKLREWADKVEKFKAKLPEGTQLQGASPIDINKLVAVAMRAVADGLEKGGEVLDLIKKAIEEIKKTNPDVDEIKLSKAINKEVINSGINSNKIDRDKSKEFAGLLDRKAFKLKAEANRAKNEFDISLKKEEAKKRSSAQKVQDTFVKWQRAFKLSNPLTMGKLMAAAITRGATTPLEDVVGGGISLIAPKFSKGAIGEGGGLNVTETAKAYKDGFIEGMKDSAQIMKRGGHGKSDIDVVFGKGGQLPPEAIDFFGQLHSATKAPIKRIIFERQLQKRFTRSINAGLDVSDPMVQSEIALGAYKDANRAIFMQDNKVTDGWQRMIRYFEQVDKKTGKPNAKGVATALQWLVPFVKVPTNIAAEIGTHVYGVPVGVAKIVYHAFNGSLENLSSDEKDIILRQLKKGSLGSAALALGYFNPQTFGGYYQDYEKRKKGDVKAGAIKIGDVNIPVWLLESPIFQAMQIGATIRRVKDAKVKGEENGLTEGIWAGALGLADHVPLIDQPMRIGKAFGNPRERQWYLGELAKGTIVPSIVQKTAEITDKEDKRSPETFMQHIEAGIPGLRENVPLPHSKSKAGGYKQPKQPSQPKQPAPSQ